jgi:hypothetical protein
LSTVRRAIRIIATVLFVEAVATRTLLRAILSGAILGRPILALLRPTLRPVIKVALWTILGTILLRAVIPVRAVFTGPAIIPHRAITIAIAVAVPIAITAFARGELAITVAAILVTAIRPSIRTLLALRAGCSCATGLIKAWLRFLATDLAAGVGLLLVIIIRRIVVRLEARARHHTSLGRRIRCLAGCFSDLLLAISQDDAVVVFGMLEIVLGQNRVAGGLGVAGQLHVFFGDVRRIAANFDIGTSRLEAPSQRVLAFVVAALVMAAAVAVAIVRSATASAILLSLPHGLPFSVMFEM